MKGLASLSLSILIACSANADNFDKIPERVPALAPVAEQSQRHHPLRRSSPVTPADWIRQNSISLTSTELVEDDSDLSALATWLSGVRVIGLGDGTHGTHEYYTVKKRLINFLAREEGINIVAFEAPWAEFNKVNEYLATGRGDPRELLRIDGYFFWEYQEMLDLVTWARSYNEAHGGSPPLRFVGVDTLPFGSRKDVIEFFEQVDPALAPSVSAKYDCADVFSSTCLEAAGQVRQLLLENRSRYEAASSPARVNDVIQSARVAEEYAETLIGPNGDEMRDRFMAENLEWFLETQGAGLRALFWGHNEHVGRNYYELSEDPSRNTTTRTAGYFLREHFGDQYYVFGACSFGGSFTAYARTTSGITLASRPMEAPTVDNYESFFKEAGSPRLIINLRRSPYPDWLSGPRPLQHGEAEFGRKTNCVNVPLRILEKFDGIIYLERTTPTVPLP